MKREKVFRSKMDVYGKKSSKMRYAFQISQKYGMENGKKHEQYEEFPVSNDFSSSQSIAIQA